MSTIVTGLMPEPKIQFFDNTGKPLVGGLLYTYRPGQPGVFKATYKSATAGDDYNTNPIVLDGGGRASVWLDGYYDMELRSSNGTTIWTQSNVSSFPYDSLAYITSVVKDNETNINLVAGSIDEVNIVADNLSDVTNFAGVYYGPSATDPTTRANGDALEDGDLYFNTVDNGLKAYANGVWYTTDTLGATDAQLVTYTAGGTGAIEATVQTELRKTFRTSNYSTFTQAVTAASGALLVVDSAVAISADTTVSVAMQMEPTGLFTVASGQTLTINGPFSCGLFQCFDGDGSVAGLKEARPEWFGGVADGVWTIGTDIYGNTTGITCTGTDSTSAIAKAIASVSKFGSIVYFQPGTYLASTIEWDSGIQLVGTGTKKTSVGGAAPTGTVIKQINGTNADFITMPSADAWIESASIKGIRFIGDPTGAATAGSGLVFNKRVGENTILSDVRFDFFPGSGIKVLRGVQPSSFSDVHLFWNGYQDATKGSGIYITRDVTDEMQAGSFINISGDSNQVALVYIEGGQPITSGGTLNFWNIKAETGETGLQQNVFVFDATSALGINVRGCSNINTGSPEATTNAIFKIINSASPGTASAPALSWSGVGAESDTAYILDDDNGSDPSVQLTNAGGSRYSAGYYKAGVIAYNGLTFGNPTPSSTDTALLDYYKRSILFTPVITPASGAFAAYTTQYGKATRIGNFVAFSIQILLNGLGTASGAITIGALPFTAETGAAGTMPTAYSVSVRANGMTSGVGDTHLQGLIAAGGTTITPSKIVAGAATQLQVTDLSATASLIITGHYFSSGS